MQTAHAGHAEGSHSSLKSYLIGFILSIILTVIPFWLVMKPSLPHDTILAGIFALAVVQIIVHLIYFLHMSLKPGQRWNLMSFAFTVLIVAFVVGGSIWIMINLAGNLMPNMSSMHGM